MSLGKQSKILSDKQIKTMLFHLSTTRMGLRNQLIFLLSAKSGLRAKEVSQLKWSMVVNSEGTVSNAIHLTDVASKGKSGRVIPLNKDVKDTYYSNKPLAVNHRKFIYYTCFKKHLNKVLTEALNGNNNEKV